MLLSIYKAILHIKSGLTIGTPKEYAKNASKTSIKLLLQN